jgi:hypothetical protein
LHVPVRKKHAQPGKVQGGSLRHLLEERRRG